jgi:hypothetical protein
MLYNTTHYNNDIYLYSHPTILYVSLSHNIYFMYAMATTSVATR